MSTDFIVTSTPPIKEVHGLEKVINKSDFQVFATKAHLKE